MTTIAIRPVLATVLSIATVSGAVALTAAEAEAASGRLHLAGGVKPPIQRPSIDRACHAKKIFFENCWWNQTTCGGKIIGYKKLSCPDLR